MCRRDALREDIWKQIEPWWIGRRGRIGVNASGNHLFVDAALYCDGACIA
ncbi:hypothetical protein LPH56_02730 [Xylella taiwanensis]|uniref:Transposase n=1 Tax=Xylella taiwanensis TaxID=1444770 RepID=Z9JM57_9GAMM|nr:hypothetical protein [Xylella taiwanensis]EWS78857.1 transposase [Xylella taiwanensis]UFS52367.1 hypothetical protein LPH56_02730 [Xylella taiwanensis]